MLHPVIISNNPLVRDRYAHPELCWQESYQQVLLAARDRVHLGLRLLMHPESGSVKPWQTPYRSLVLEGEPGALDFTSLAMIEPAIERFRHFSPSSRQICSEEILRDFQLIDFNLLRQCMECHYP
ncbi:MAG: GrdX family protein [Enterobacteriaceae bacterium]